MEKVKLMCSYGGRIQPRPHDRQLSYVGGDTKILTVDRNVNFASLVSKLQTLCETNSEIRFKYQLPGHDLDALISVFNDDDVEHMMFEYDLLRRSSTKPARIRLFLFFPTAVTPVTGRSLNPDFLFGFDQDYSYNYAVAAAAKKSVVPDQNAGTVSSPNENAGSDSGNGAPKQIQGIPAQGSGGALEMTRGNYGNRAPPVYGVPVVGGYFQAGQVRGVQPVLAISDVNREQPVYTFVPVIPSAPEPNIPMGGHVSNGNHGQGGSPVGYDATKSDSLHLTVTMAATSTQEPKVSPPAQHDA